LRNLTGLATAIGSLPHQDIEAALDLVFEACPEVPFWPQLPKRDKREGMVAQFLQGLPVLQAFDTQPAPLEEFYEKVLNRDLNFFQITPEYAAGLYAFKERLLKEKKLLERIEFIKCQITGPFTLAAALKDETGTAYLHNPVMLQAIIEGLAMKACWQINFFKEFKKKMILFIDEPYLGCFGSAYTPLNREDVVKGLTALAGGIKSPEVLIGLHCCGNTDWSIFTEIKQIDIINFDADEFLERFLLYADALKGFVKRNGMICWGIVPTKELSGKETPALLAQKIKAALGVLEKKGLDGQLLQQNLFISPSCGLGTLEIATAAKILGLLSETSALLGKSV
jgi:methionine synthase II (cobalamin-independent)